MCAAAAYWAGIERIYFGATVGDALEYGGFDDAMIFEQLRRPTQIARSPRRRCSKKIPANSSAPNGPVIDGGVPDAATPPGRSLRAPSFSAASAP